LWIEAHFQVGYLQACCQITLQFIATNSGVCRLHTKHRCLLAQGTASITLCAQELLLQTKKGALT